MFIFSKKPDFNNHEMRIDEVDEDYVDIKFITPTNANSREKQNEIFPYQSSEEDIDKKWVY